MKKQIIFLWGMVLALCGFTVLLTCLTPAETVMAPENGDADLIVVSKTGSQNIDSVNFKIGDAEYSMGEIGAHKCQSITLEQGTWETRLNYTQEGIAKTCNAITAITAPANDPGIIAENHLYFYLNKHGDYSLSQAWPPFPNDADELDILPPDAGYGRGIIQIVNNSYSPVEMVTIRNLQDDNSLVLNCGQFAPACPVQNNKTCFVEVAGTPEFPIAHGEYLVQITMKSDEGIGIIERKVYIKDKVIMIVIAGGELMLQNS
jgi:hypothetical protein